MSGGIGRRSSGVGKVLFPRLAAYVRRNRWERRLSFGEHEREDLGYRVRREGFLLLYNRSLLPDPRDMFESWNCCWETFWLSVLFNFNIFGGKGSYSHCCIFFLYHL